MAVSTVQIIHFWSGLRCTMIQRPSLLLFSLFLIVIAASMPSSASLGDGERASLESLVGAFPSLSMTDLRQTERSVRVSRSNFGVSGSLTTESSHWCSISPSSKLQGVECSNGNVTSIVMYVFCLPSGATYVFQRFDGQKLTLL